LGLKRIRYVVDDFAGSGWYRAQVPAAELRRRGHDATVGSSLDKDTVPGLDVVVLERQFLEAARYAIEDANDQGKVTVYDIDDDYWHVPPTNPGYDVWQMPDMLSGVEDCVRAVKVVTTPSPVLAASLGRLNPNVRILPNMLPGPDWPEPSREPRSGRVIVGWAGGGSHFTDLKLLSGVVEQLLSEFPGVEFRTHGVRDVPFQPAERLKVLPGVPLAEYPELLATFDIGVAPLEDTLFNRSKSDLKVVEYGAVGIPVVASKVAPYEASVRSGKTGFLAGSAKDWLKELRRLVTDAGARTELGSAGRRFAETRFIGRDANIALWERAYLLDAGA
jgi:glycosyltransferase involved in cell wall biosynthesis